MDFSEIQDHLGEMGHAGIPNYIVPGLTSWLVGGTPNSGKVRMFINSREQEQFITPHSHRFDLACCVLKGWVANSIYTADGGGDTHYVVTTLKFDGSIGSYTRGEEFSESFRKVTTRYKEGDWYWLSADDIHTIVFSADAQLLIFEGPQSTVTSQILEPMVDNHHIKTFEVKDWMFK